MAEEDNRHIKAEASARNMRQLLILEEMARLGVPATPSEINRGIGLPKQTIHRIFATLEEAGFVQREHDGRSYSPGPRARQMSAGLISSLRVRSARLVVMNALAERIGETCNLAIPDRDGMLYLDRVETHWPLRIQFPIGTKVPFHCTAAGKLFLSTLTPRRLDLMLEKGAFERRTPQTLTDPAALKAEIKTIRKQGYSQDNEEFMDGMVALAVAVRDANGRMFASLSFHAPTPRMSMHSALEYIDDLREAAEALSRIVTSEGALET